MRARPGAAKLGRRTLGVAFLLALALLAWLCLALYSKRFTPVVLVTLTTGTAGNEMNLGAEVKVRGVQVGEVRQISSSGHGARLLLAISPAAARRLPANVSAEMLPATLFGERYVDLVLPRFPSRARLAEVRTISQARSKDAVELQQVLDNLLPMLRAVQPDRLSVVLTAIAQGLSGRGHGLGQTLARLDQVLGSINPRLPALDADLRELAGFARTYAQAAPDILAALDDLSVTSQTIAQERAQLAALYPAVTSASADLASFLRANSGNIIRLSATGRGVLAALARYAPEYPCTLANLVRLEPVISKILGKGTRRPGLHVIAHVVPSRGRYLPGVDSPRFDRNTGPRCFSLPLAATSAHPRWSAKVVTRAAVTSTAAGDGELVRELAALALGRAPGALPGWTSVLVGPVFRGRAVTLQEAG